MVIQLRYFLRSRIFLKSLALSSYWEFSMRILKLHVKRAQERSSVFGSQWFYFIKRMKTHGIVVRVSKDYEVLLRLSYITHLLNINGIKFIFTATFSIKVSISPCWNEPASKIWKRSLNGPNVKCWNPIGPICLTTWELNILIVPCVKSFRRDTILLLFILNMPY